MDLINRFLQKMGIDVGSAALWTEGFIWGIAFIFLVLVLIKIIMIFRTMKTQCKGIAVSGERGSLFVSKSAVTDFVSKDLIAFSQFSVNNVELRTSGDNYNIKILAQSEYETNLINLRDEIQNKIVNSLEDKLGIANIKNVDIDIKRFVKSKETPQKNKIKPSPTEKIIED
ncbi:MAG: alkaline shock response membrane anchor protein AmaP [Verrucomicrobiota bacterium]|nr:alkaline shock response membrane anchor protein AmaP [Verrucomicrobiota bacterium]